MRFVFFGSSALSKYVLEELETRGFKPALNITSAKGALPALPEADVYIVASFGKILPEEVIYRPKHGTLNVHPSLLPRLRGPSPIQGLILGNEEPGVTIMRMDERVDHGPIVAQEKVAISPWPDHYRVVEEKLARAGGKLLAEILPDWLEGKIPELPQDETKATYTKLVKKEDGLLNFNDSAETNLRKVYAYSTWPGAYIYFRGRTGEKRVIIKDAKIIEGVFTPSRIVPEGKKEMDWQAFLRGNA